MNLISAARARGSVPRQHSVRAQNNEFELKSLRCSVPITRKRSRMQTAHRNTIPVSSVRMRLWRGTGVPSLPDGRSRRALLFSLLPCIFQYEECNEIAGTMLPHANATAYCCSKVSNGCTQASHRRRSVQARKTHLPFGLASNGLQHAQSSCRKARPESTQAVGGNNRL
jgi:hypothetical protein